MSNDASKGKVEHPSLNHQHFVSPQQHQDLELSSAIAYLNARDHYSSAISIRQADAGGKQGARGAEGQGPQVAPGSMPSLSQLDAERVIHAASISVSNMTLEDSCAASARTKSQYASLSEPSSAELLSSLSMQTGVSALAKPKQVGHVDCHALR